MTKGDFSIFQERIENRFVQNQQQIQSQIREIQNQIKESEYRLTTRLGFLMISTVSVAVAVLTWLIKI